MRHIQNRFWVLATGLFVLAAGLLLLSFHPALASNIYHAAGAPSAAAVKPIGARAVTPSQMALSGDYLVCGASFPDPRIAAFCAGLPAGSIVLGVNPASAEPSLWRGATAEVQLTFPEVTQPAYAVINIGWPGGSNHGLFSPDVGWTARVAWDGVTVWNKSTRDLLVPGRYYAAKDSDVLTTVTLNRAGPFTLRIEVPPKTAWAISRVQLNVYPQLDHAQPGNLRGIAYNPYRDCETPDWGPEPTEAEIREDMARMAHTSSGLRTYSALGINGQIPHIAKDYNLRVCAGAWLGREKDENGVPVVNKNRQELDALIALANDPTIQLDCVIIGNEVLLRKDLSEAQYIDYIKEVKSKIPARIPVSIAEVYDLMLTHPKVVAELNWLQIHIYPYWHGQPINQSVDWVIKQYRDVQKAYPTKKVIIGETGWPSAGPARGYAEPSMNNQQQFLYQFIRAADEQKVDYYYFDTFDEMWKREGGVGSHWGYLYSNRTGKHDLQSLLVPAQEVMSSRIYLPNIMAWGSLWNSLAGGLLRLPGLLPSLPASGVTGADLPPQPGTVFWVFQNYVSDENHFAPSGFMGDINDLNLFECARDDYNSPETYIRVQYTPQGPQHWAGIYWQEPAQNWGTQPDRGYNLDNANTLRFWARSEQEGVKVRFFMGGIWTKPEYSDTLQPAQNTDVVTLTREWKEYTIDLRGLDLRRVIGGFGFSVDNCLDPQPVTFYLDNIRYDLTGDPGKPAPPPPPTTPYTFDIYRDKDQPGNHYTPSGWMGDTGDITLDECYRSDPRAGSTAVRVAYTGQGQGPSYGCSGSQPCGWASVYWQDPANSWGTKPGGYNLSGAVGISFWARGDKGGELVTFKAGGMNCGPVAFPETFCPSIVLDPDPITLTTTWQKYTIPFPAGTNLSRVMGPFVWAVSKRDNASGAVFYLDDIQYLFNQAVPPQGHSIYAGPRLAPGYDMGVDTYGGLTNWVTNLGGSMRADYPAGQSWGAVFITYGPPLATYPRPGQNLSAYKTLTIDLRGQIGGETVSIGLKDNTDADKGGEKTIPVTLTADWKTYTFPLSGFTTADLTHLYVPAELVFPANKAETIYFRNIRYLP